MRYLNIKATNLLILTCLLLTAAGIYCIKLVFSESLYIENNIIEYYLLVPAIIKDIPLEQTDHVMRYYYSAADGNKPAIASVKFTTLKPAKEWFVTLMALVLTAVIMYTRRIVMKYLSLNRKVIPVRY